MTTVPTFFANQPAALQLAAEAALAAGQIIRDGYKDVHNVEAKEVGDLVSQVDIDADKAATKILNTDGLPILSEELNPETADANADMWIVDPLDGTTAYLMKGGPHFSSVLIAQRRDGDTHLGLTYFPLTDEWFYAVRGQGAWKNGHPLTIARTDIPLSKSWVEMNQYGNAEFETAFFKAARRALRASGGAQIVTSSFPHAGVAMRIAEESSGLTIAIHDNNPASLKQGPWDIAANQVIFEEAGGVFVNPQGERTSPFKAEPIIIAANADLATRVIECCTQTA